MDAKPITKQQFLNAAKAIAAADGKSVAMLSQVAAANRVTAEQFRPFDPELADLLDGIAGHQEQVTQGFKALDIYVADKLEK